MNEIVKMLKFLIKEREKYALVIVITAILFGILQLYTNIILPEFAICFIIIDVLVLTIVKLYIDIRIHNLFDGLTDISNSADERNQMWKLMAPIGKNKNFSKFDKFIIGKKVITLKLSDAADLLFSETCTNRKTSKLQMLCATIGVRIFDEFWKMFCNDQKETDDKTGDTVFYNFKLSDKLITNLEDLIKASEKFYTEVELYRKISESFDNQIDDCPKNFIKNQLNGIKTTFVSNNVDYEKYKIKDSKILLIVNLSLSKDKSGINSNASVSVKSVKN